MSPIVVIPFHQRDHALAQKQAQHILELGGASEFDCLLVHERHMPADGILQPLLKAFKNVLTFNPAKVPEADWSAGTGDARAANEVWIQTAWHMAQKINRSWLYLEPDCVPLKNNWLHAIQAAYRDGRKRIMAARVTPSNGKVRTSGIAVYPPQVMECGQAALLTERVPWDIAGAEDFVKHANFTPLIHHVLRDSKLAPTFPDQNSLQWIPSEAVIFHPCKDGSLIDRLRERRNGIETPKPAGAPTSEYIAELKSLPVNPVAVENARLKAELEQFKAQLKSSEPERKTVYAKSKRTPEEQEKINARMAKARAGRKKKLTGVK